MDLRKLNPADMKRVPGEDVSPRDIRWLAEVDIDRAALEKRWGPAETTCDNLGEWHCFAFSPAEGEAFLLLREVENPPTPQFGLSVTTGLFSPSAADRIVESLGIAGARVTQVNAEAGSQRPPLRHAFTAPALRRRRPPGEDRRLTEALEVVFSWFAPPHVSLNSSWVPRVSISGTPPLDGGGIGARLGMRQASQDETGKSGLTGGPWSASAFVAPQVMPCHRYMFG
ncbi:hypothetical protein ACIGDI_34685 [Streptomyces sp. NPDC085900]|uniref:hypothetical protein n=1 Tax=Streptomyces sp. NPDC085900 TaxID=3365737 RepID=UPI0037D52381